MTPTSTRDITDPRSLQKRVKLADFRVESAGADATEARVAVQWKPDRVFEGVAVGDTSPRSQLRLAAEATARALEQASEGKVGLEVLAVKAVEGFDTVIVVVSLASQADGIAERLVGSCLIKGHATRGAVLAVLTATNRLFGRVVHGPPDGAVPEA